MRRTSATTRAAVAVMTAIASGVGYALNMHEAVSVEIGVGLFGAALVGLGAAGGWVTIPAILFGLLIASLFDAPPPVVSGDEEPYLIGPLAALMVSPLAIGLAVVGIAARGVVRRREAGSRSAAA